MRKGFIVSLTLFVTGLYTTVGISLVLATWLVFQGLYELWGWFFIIPGVLLFPVTMGVMPLVFGFFYGWWSPAFMVYVAPLVGVVVSTIISIPLAAMMEAEQREKEEREQLIALKAELARTVEVQ